MPPPFTRFLHTFFFHLNNDLFYRFQCFKNTMTDLRSKFSKNFVHFFSPSLCKVCGYAPSTSILVHTYLRMPEYDLNCGLSYPFLYANYTAFHISYAKYAGMPPPLPSTFVHLYFRPPLHWSAHVLYNDSSSSLRGGPLLNGRIWAKNRQRGGLNEFNGILFFWVGEGGRDGSDP